MNKGKWVLAISFGLVAILNSCKEDTGGVGANVLPNSDIISVYATDTTTVLTSMYLKDSALTNGTNNAMLGSYSDPILGTAKASIYAMIYSTVGSSSVAWKDTGAVDSAVLLLPVAGFYGTPSQQTFLVYQTTSIIGTGKAYYSDTTMAYDPIPIGTAQQTPNLATSDTIRIKLSRTWLNGIVASMNSNSSYYYPDVDSLIHGLYITMSNTLQLPEQGAIYYINLNSSFSGITFYWHSIEPTVPQPEYRINFPVGNNGGYLLTGYFTHVDHNYSTAAFASEHPMGKKDSINGNNLVYVQSMGGVIGRINFPNFYKNWSKLGPVIVNKAEVDMTVDIQDCPNPFVPPANLILGGTDKYGNPYNLPDENAITQLFGGAYDPFNYTYTFNITDYMQNIIQNKDTDRGLFIVPANGPITANRVVLYGAQHGSAIPPANRMKLIMYYSPLATHKATKH